MSDTPAPFRAKVMNSGKKAILMLPARAKVPHMPLAETHIMVEGRPAVAKFAKIAINVLRFGGANMLTTTLQEWFGEDAGRPGTRAFVEFTFIDGLWHMRPVRD